ncbi:MAG: CoA-binding protein [Nitriliruptoraceae bacterium]
MVESDEQDIADLLDRAHRIAVVGLSSNPARPSYEVAARLQTLGYDIVPVNPNVTEVLGVAAIPSLADIDGHIDIVDVFRRPAFATDIARDAVAIGAEALWLQLGVTSQQARTIAESADLRYIEDRCLGVDAARHHRSR